MPEPDKNTEFVYCDTCLSTHVIVSAEAKQDPVTGEFKFIDLSYVTGGYCHGCQLTGSHNFAFGTKSEIAKLKTKRLIEPNKL